MSRTLLTLFTTIMTGVAVLLGAPGAAQASASVGDVDASSAAVSDPLLFYRAGDGLAVTGSVDGGGNFTSLQGVGGFSLGWTHITSVGGGRVLFYRAGDGLAVTGVVSNVGGFTNLRTVGGFSLGWTLVTLAST
ncbi:hypothetical protein AB0F15_31400 [Amycolatopsis sp. NPDC026612]|uniref:hypothetical protein n=1 Tax=Amycolatopsis sp. NPDC026612 TaxID=3155466 RepID=UPI0033FB284E